MAQADQPAGNASSRAPSVAAEAAGGYLLAGLLIFGGIGVVARSLARHDRDDPSGNCRGLSLGGYLVYLRVVRVGHENDGEVQNGRRSGMAEGDSR